MIKKTFLIFLFFSALLSVFSQKAVYQLPLSVRTTINEHAFFYSLPQTAFKADVVVTKTTNIKGLYADFAEKLLGITNYCKVNATTFKLKTITLTPFTVPDEELQFVVLLSSTQIKNNFLNSLYENNSVKGFQSASVSEQKNDELLPDFFKNFADVIMQQTYETYTETKIIDGVVTQVPVTQTKTTTKTVAQQAQQAADFIEKIRDDRYAILSLSQEAALSKESFEYLVNQLNDLEKKYLELFTGITIFEDIHETTIVYPKTELKLLPLFSVTPEGGFSTSMCKTAAYNYYLKCAPHTPTSSQVDFFEDSAQNSNQKKSAGYRIRKANPSFVSLVNGNIEEMLGVFPIEQFGILKTLPLNMDTFDIGKWGYIY
jgi:hypothetical protein